MIQSCEKNVMHYHTTLLLEKVSAVKFRSFGKLSVDKYKEDNFMFYLCGSRCTVGPTIPIVI
jgi:hypothetical protein